MDLSEYKKEDLAKLLKLITTGSNNLSVKDYLFLKTIQNLTEDEILSYLKM
jgi:hypothetical protein